MQAVAEALKRHVCCFFGGFEGRASDLLTRNGGVGNASPVILRPELAAQPQCVSHTLLPSAPLHPATNLQSTRAGQNQAGRSKPGVRPRRLS
jgi:hypothetical protein